jgi:hypothetical protein
MAGIGYTSPTCALWKQFSNASPQTSGKLTADEHERLTALIRTGTTSTLVQRHARVLLKAGATVEWRFTTADARIKLKKLYPVLKLS